MIHQKDAQISGTCEYVTLHSKREFVHVVEVICLKMEKLS